MLSSRASVVGWPAKIGAKHMPQGLNSLPGEEQQIDRVSVLEEQPAGESEIDLFDLFRIVGEKKSTVFKAAGVAALVTALVVFLLRPTYTAQASFLPPSSMNTGSSAALLGQLGALSGAGNALSALRDPSLLYVGILGSRTVADEIISKFNLANVYGTKKLSQTERALKKHTKIVPGKDSIILIDVDDHDPKRAADIANGYLAALRNINDRIALTESGQRRLFFQRQLDSEKNSLADAEVDLARAQVQTGMIQPTSQAQFQIGAITQTQAEIASREVQLAALSQAATDQNPEVIRIRSEIAGLKNQLTQLENSSNHRGPGNVQVPTADVPELGLVYLRKAREVKYHEALYELLLKQYESARLDESRASPLVQVVDYAITPDTKSGPPRVLLTLAAGVMGTLCGVGWLLFRHNQKLSQTNETSI